MAKKLREDRLKKNDKGDDDYEESDLFDESSDNAEK